MIEVVRTMRAFTQQHKRRISDKIEQRVVISSLAPEHVRNCAEIVCRHDR
jgi:hypothetical protein